MRRETRSHSSQQGDAELDAPPLDGPEAAHMVAESESNPSGLPHQAATWCTAPSYSFVTDDGVVFASHASDI